ncbi:MAG TPA: flagellar biosynthesis anti-sigma factor FlgM [Armatimonadota bacterium]|jgi:hypothetical protein
MRISAVNHPSQSLPTRPATEPLRESNSPSESLQLSEAAQFLQELPAALRQIPAVRPERVCAARARLAQGEAISPPAVARSLMSALRRGE